MKISLSMLLFLAAVAGGWAATTIDPAHDYAYGANLGWMDWRGEKWHGALA